MAQDHRFIDRNLDLYRDAPAEREGNITAVFTLAGRMWHRRNRELRQPLGEGGAHALHRGEPLDGQLCHRLASKFRMPTIQPPEPDRAQPLFVGREK